MNDDTCTLNVKGLDQLLKALKAAPPVCRVGVLGEGNSRQPKEGEKHIPTNSEVGAVHEFGSPARGIPVRSFLRIPISGNLTKYLSDNGTLNKQTMKAVIKSGSVLPWMERVAATALTIVKDAFATQGFGKWPAWKDSNYSNNANMVLVDTTQLRDSITSEVKAR
jgi:phage gpG-like protein